MEDAALYRTMRRLVFVSPILSQALLSGDFRSAFKGRGMDFDSIREYSVGDDARSIDWNATVRFGRPYVKTWKDDRGLSVYIVFDASASMDYGTERSRRDTAALAASLLSYACMLNEIKVGALLFGGERLEHVEPDSGRKHACALIDRFVAGVADGLGSDVGKALGSARAHLKRRTLVFVFSDFKAERYALPLALLSRGHDCVCVHVRDPADATLPAERMAVRSADAESGRASMLFLSSRLWRESMETSGSATRLEFLSAVRAARASHLDLDTGSDPAKALLGFFDRRRREP